MYFTVYLINLRRSARAGVGGRRGVGGRAVELIMTANNRPLSVRYVLGLQGVSKVRSDCKLYFAQSI